MKTAFATPERVRRDWYLVDASGKTLGRLASQIAMRLRGKHKPEFTPHVDCGDYIIVINAEKVAVTGNKKRDKVYQQHTGYLGNLKTVALGKLLAEHPERAIEFAVKGMLPKADSAGRCTASSTCSQAPRIRTPHSSRSSSSSKDPNMASSASTRHRPAQVRLRRASS